ncbi:MAG: DUF4835 family protein [Bacteroides sp.]|nr:DUF4835 family protein [Bacteroides sp.]
MWLKTFAFILLFCATLANLGAQELDCKLTVNSSQIQGTNVQVFKTLEAALNDFLNTRRWTQAQYAANERIRCSMTLTVKEYNEVEARWTCELTVQSIRPVWQSGYQTPLFLHKDTEVTFTYREFDPLELRDNVLDNNLTAIMAYYAYLLIGLDMDAMAPEGGTDILRLAENILAAATSLGEIGWTAFEESHNRHALLSDYLNEGLRPLRQLMYEYHRKGLDQFTLNATRARATITASLEQLKVAKEQKPMSAWPGLFAEIKKEELINIYSQASAKEKETVSELLLMVNPSLMEEWERLKK